MKEIAFEKYEAAGNDFIVVDIRSDKALYSECLKRAKMMCDRHFGIGADGILIVSDSVDPISSVDVDGGMIVINADGSIAEMCGNGIRCVAKYLVDRGEIGAKKALRIASGAGVQIVHRVPDDRFEVEMAKAILKDTVCIRHGEREWTGRVVDVGNPHAVFEIEDSIEQALSSAGKYLSNHQTFPNKSNIEFIRKTGKNAVDMVVYERGVGPTLACGTGCVAAAVAFADNHGLSDVTVALKLPGGALEVILSENSIRLCGGANRVFSGIFKG